MYGFFLYNGMIVLITGCSSQVGRAVTKKYAMNGHTVIATDTEKTDFLNKNIHEFEMNITSKNSIRSVKETISADFGSIDIFINCATSNGGGSITETLLGDIKDVYETNIYAIKRVLDVFYDMLNESEGYLVNLSMYNTDRMADNNVYSSSKEAMKSIMDSLQTELDSITILFIEPSITDAYGQKICDRVVDKAPSTETRLTDLFRKSPEQIADITYSSTRSTDTITHKNRIGKKTQSLMQKLPDQNYLSAKTFMN